ncbi:polyribonucleotide nucleotidyltransferase [Patescibacteria group bacterium]|nr:polyribonucleotide nucleotidyltransferase [Patescibacteria group bacterium]MBU4452901.1 polyribonucleotide nucleotidyltransferase [Patescibacteria group bacterium]MCG2687916.1 polyribonucleotide nucleotidyltransferase [Candidatus Parcubacteria bacterium]
MTQKTFTCELGDKTITIETGKLAQSANASCTVRCGDTVVLVTAVMSKDQRPDMGYFPLMVDYEEKLYAAGRIKGSRYIKREGRPTDEAVLVGRFIDRAVRPLFDESLRRDVQIIVTALAFDGQNDPDILGLIGASCALHMSDIPWNGPIGALRVSQVGGEWILNPTYAQRDESIFDLDIAGTTQKVIMIEARANEAGEEIIQKAFEHGMQNMQPVIDLIQKVRSEIGKEKLDLNSLMTDKDQEIKEKREALEQKAKSFMRPIFEEKVLRGSLKNKSLIGDAKADLAKNLEEYLTTEGHEADEIAYAKNLIYNFAQDEASRIILEKGKRIDGRELTQIRDLVGEVALLPRVHGSGMFMRGTTQALSVCTLGAPGDEQTMDGMELVGQKRYMHHYNFPPFSVGEAKPLRGASRRDIGHGALAEKALDPMIPAKEDFPYAIRVVSETLDSNGSSSMASTCASTLALMDAGVPIKAPVAGIAMGLASNGKEWKVLTDLQDIEDGLGGMDFKITGSRDGITAIQMDTKTDGITMEIIKQALTQSYNARMEVLDVIEKTISAPRTELSLFAPRIIKMQIHPDKIREVIGSGGKVINEIIATTGVQAIDIEDDGMLFITAPDAESAAKAQKRVEDITRTIAPGEEFEGTVDRLMDFGAIVSYLPGRDGLVHVSELAPWRVDKVSDIVNVGDKVKIKVIEVDPSGKTSLSMKQATGNAYTDEMKAKAQKPGEGGGRPGGDRGPRYGGGRPGGHRSDGPRPPRPNRPSIPTSFPKREE